MEEEKQEKTEEKTITIKKSDLWRYSTFLLVAVVVIGGFFMFTGGGEGTITGNAANNEPSIVKASIDDDAILGDENAPVTIIEFSDYQCPFCRKFWTETFKELKTNYIDTGKVKLVYRDFPLSSLHPMAQASAEATECVHEQGGDEAYWEMHNKLFAEQNILDSGSASGAVTKTVVYTNDDLKSWASDLGYDIGSCLDSGKYKSEVLKDSNDAGNAGGSGTPYFVIMKSGDKEGTPLSGAYPYDTFKQIIDSLA